MVILSIIGWAVLGSMGYMLLYVDFKLFHARLERRQPRWCPTPLNIIWSAVIVFGLFVFLVGVGITLANGELLKGKLNWFNKPICDWNRQ